MTIKSILREYIGGTMKAEHALAAIGLLLDDYELKDASVVLLDKIYTQENIDSADADLNSIESRFPDIFDGGGELDKDAGIRFKISYYAPKNG